MVDGRVLVIGGGGFYGRYLVEDLIQFTDTEIVVASRHPPTTWDGAAGRVRTATCDVTDLAPLEHVMSGCQVVIHCAGPFWQGPINPLQAAIHMGTHYIDIAETRAYLKEVRTLEEEIRRAGIAVLSGISVAPAMEALFAEMLRTCFDTLVTEWPFLNRLLGTAAGIRMVTGHPDWRRFTPFIRAFSWLVGRFGKDEGAVVFEIQGLQKGILITHRVAVVARRHGGLIPAVLAGMATGKLLSGQLKMKGIIPIHQWVGSEDLVEELSARGLELWWQPQEATEWRMFSFTDYRSYAIR